MGIVLTQSNTFIIGSIAKLLRIYHEWNFQCVELYWYLRILVLVSFIFTGNCLYIDDSDDD